MPKRIRRADELPVPFTPAEVEHVDNFPRTDQEYEEANATDVAATGADDLANATCSLYHHHVSLSASALEARLAWMAVATRIHYRIISARYDYLVASKNEHGLAELHLATDAVPRNKGRGPGWQRFFNAVSADEAKVFTKSAAEVRLNAPKRRHKRRQGPGGGGGGGGEGGRGSGGGGGGGGGGGEGGGGRKGDRGKYGGSGNGQKKGGGGANGAKDGGATSQAAAGAGGGKGGGGGAQGKAAAATASAGGNAGRA